MKKRTHRWVLWDLNNGPDHGSKKRYTYYVWVHRTRALARQQLRQHRNNPHRFAALSGVEKLPTRIINARYAPVPGCVDAKYRYRKADRIPM